MIIIIFLTFVLSDLLFVRITSITEKKECRKEKKRRTKQKRKLEKERKKEEKKQGKRAKKTNDNKEADRKEEETEIYKIWDENEEPENGFEEEEDEQEEDEEDSINVDEIDSGKVKIFKMEEYWCRLSLPTMEKELIDKWYACIFLHNQSAGLYIGRMKKRFLNDEGGMVLALELDCLERKLGVTDNILREAKRKDVSIFPVKDIIFGPFQMNPQTLGVSIV